MLLINFLKKSEIISFSHPWNAGFLMINLFFVHAIGQGFPNELMGRFEAVEVLECHLNGNDVPAAY